MPFYLETSSLILFRFSAHLESRKQRKRETCNQYNIAEMTFMIREDRTESRYYQYNRKRENKIYVQPLPRSPSKSLGRRCLVRHSGPVERFCKYLVAPPIDSYNSAQKSARTKLSEKKRINIPIVPSLGSERVRKMKMPLITVPESRPAERTKLNFDHHRNLR